MHSDALVGGGVSANTITLSEIKNTRGRAQIDYAAIKYTRGSDGNNCTTIAFAKIRFSSLIHNTCIERL